MSKKNLKIISSYVLVWIISSYIYLNYIVETFSYEGYEAKWSIESILIAFLGFILIVIFSIRLNESNFSYIFFNLMILVSIIPLSVLCGFAGKSIIYYIEVVFVICFSILIASKNKLIYKFQKYFVSEQKLLYLFLGCSLILLFIIYYYNGFNSFNLNLYEVYNFRDDAAEDLPNTLAYFTSSISKIMLPVSCILLLKYKNYSGLFFAILICIALFGFTSHKSILFAPFLLLSIYYLIGLKDKLLKIIYAYFFLLVVSIIAFYFSQNLEIDLSLMLASIAFRRALIVPAELNYTYYELFSDIDFIYWANSKLSLGLLDFTHEKGISEIVGDFRFPGTGTHANTGWLGSGYAHAGFFGIFVYAIIISCFLIYADYAVLNAEDENLAASILIMPSIVLMTSSDLPTSFMTHGLIFSLLIISILKKKYL